MHDVLIRFAHGLGDVVQLTVVLKHLRRHRPDWNVDVRCGRGKHTALTGLCRRVYHDQEPEPTGPYRSVVELYWFENYNGYTDRPNSKVTNCLHENFGLPWDADLGRYEVRVGDDARQKAAAYFTSIGAPFDAASGRYKAVVLHYEGNTSPHKKNLPHYAAQAVVDAARRHGRAPVVLDWDRRSPLPDQTTVFCPDARHPMWGGFGSGDAGVIAALIALAECYVGIDSGPGKIASAVDTPALICWRGHHPLQFHDPAPNTTHLVPRNHDSLAPLAGNPGAAAFFEAAYDHRVYDGEHELAAQAAAFVADALGERDGAPPRAPDFVVPNGIGDAMWALTKIRSVAGGRPIDVVLSGDPRREIDHRAEPFLRRFPFVRGLRVADVPVLHDRQSPTNSRGRYHYVPDGPRGQYHFLVPNATLEAGGRLETWLPEHPVDWDVVKEFNWAGTERGRELGVGLDPFAAFYLGPEAGHTDEGHNRGWLWEPRHWVELGLAFRHRGLNVAVVGADYDRSFWERYVRPGVEQAGLRWFDLIGKLEIGETFAFLRESRCLVSYQCGLGIVGHYLGVKVAMWWRPDGDSGHPKYPVCFHDAMKDAWVRPGWEANYMGLLYRRETPAEIMAEIDRRGWLK